jgi:transposase-like protein
MVIARKKEKDIIDQILDNINFHGLTQDAVVGQNGLIKQLTGNSRNGHFEKTVLLENQSAAIEVPRDRKGTFEPVIVPKNGMTNIR